MKRIGLIVFGIFVYSLACAQTETTKWYIEGELYDTTSCESGNYITMPQVPERFGYTFSGWEPAIYDMSTLDASINGTTNSYSGIQWRTIFSYGEVHGESLCSSSAPKSNYDRYINEVNFNTENGSGPYCYCRVTDFVPTDSTIVYESKSSYWVHNSADHGLASNCTLYCPRSCGSFVKTDNSLRTKIYGNN